MAEPEDQRLEPLVQQEQAALARVLAFISEKKAPRVHPTRPDYDAQLIGLRDQLAEARLEDMPPLIERMTQLQRLAARVSTVRTPELNPDCPYFGRLVLQEDNGRREVFIGTTTCIDTTAAIRVVDWRNAPVSRLYYRYEQGDDYAEQFGQALREGTVLLRRELEIEGGQLRRIATRELVLSYRENTGWQPRAHAAPLGGGGEGLSASHTLSAAAKQRISLSDADLRLGAITALIDRSQFELITRPDSGIVVIQGGAGSGKTTIGLHRIAYLNYHNRRRFSGDRILVLVYNLALARYMSAALPALGMKGVAIRTFADWAYQQRRTLVPELKVGTAASQPNAVSHFMRHPALLMAARSFVDRQRTQLGVALSRNAPPNSEIQRQLHQQFSKHNRRPLAHQIRRTARWLESAAVPKALRNTLSGVLRRASSQTDDLVSAWADMLTDAELLGASFETHPEPALSATQVQEALRWYASHADAVAERQEQALAGDAPPKRDRRALDAVALTPDDDTLLLFLAQELRGPLLRSGSEEPLTYNHLFIDETQDFSPLELAVALRLVGPDPSITLAGDMAQRIDMTNGLTSLERSLPLLTRNKLEVAPLRLAYRSTREILDFAQEVLGPLAPSERPIAKRSGAPVECFAFLHEGQAVAFLALALRNLLARERKASVAVVARHPASAALYHAGLALAETPGLRHVTDQGFEFKPGVDVTDVAQVKGLEFDYVILVDVNDTHYPATDEARHLLHIGATRAAHQLWLLATGNPSSLIPPALLKASERPA